MATVTTFVTGQPTIDQDHIRLQKVDNYLDFSANNATATDIVQALNIPANAVVVDVKLRVVTAEGGTATVDIGDTVDPNGYDDSVNINATAGTITASIKGTDAYAVGRYYSTAGTIDLIIDNNLDTAVLYISAEYFITDRMAS